MTGSAVTIVVVPRERFSSAVNSLETICAHTRPDIPLIYIDGNSPRRVARHLREIARARKFKLIRTQYYLSPNEARNLALSYVTTKYVVFVDNDIEVSSDWLDALVDCAEETGAWVVGPLVMAGEPGRELIHQAGGAAHIEEVEGRRRFVEQHYRLEQALEKTVLQREITEFVEFHGMLVRIECFARVARLDEQLLSMYEHLDFCMSVRAAGGQVFLEPRSVIRYHPTSPRLSDLPFYFLRWSDDWNKATHQRFQDKWRLDADDPAIRYSRDWVTDFRQAQLRELRPFVDRLTRGRSYPIERRFLAPLEERICKYVARWASRNRPGPPVSPIGAQRGERMNAALRAN